MDNERIVDGFYTLISKKTTPSKEDPMYLSIEKSLSGFSKDDLYSFYEFFSESTDYFNEAGFSSMVSFKKAVNDYKDLLATSMWNKYSLYDKVEQLTLKVVSVMDFMKTVPADKLDMFFSHDEWKKFKEAQTGKPVISEDELDEYSVFRALDIKALYFKYVDQWTTSCIKEAIEQAYKTHFLRKRITDSPAGIGYTGRSGELNGEQIAKRTLSLLGGTIKRIQ